MKKKIYIFAGGTLNQVAPHLALAAPAFGTVGIQLQGLLQEHLENEHNENYEVIILPTAMALGNVMNQVVWEEFVKQAESVYQEAGLKGIGGLRTNQDMMKVVDLLVSRKDTRCIIMSSAVCDFHVSHIGNKELPKNGIYPERLDSSYNWSLDLEQSEKIIDRIRKERKDIFLVSFKATYDQPNALYNKALSQLKRSSSNLVFGNDIYTKRNIIVTPEEYPYEYKGRIAALYALSDMIVKRLDLSFDRTIMRPDEELADINELQQAGAIPSNFAPVLQHAITFGAFKPFKQKTTGHFGCVVEGQDFQRISSVRKVNHNRVFQEGVAKIYINKNLIEAGGARPSVGEHTQQQIYRELGDRVHSVIHFHCPLRDPENFEARRLQFPYECGSVECGVNTTRGMQDFGDGIWAVHLDAHGPNIAFHRDTDPQKVIDFINTHWDLKSKEGGLIEPEISFKENM